MREKHSIKLAIWVLFTIFIVYITFMGLIINYSVIFTGANQITLGIDLKGGIHAIMTPQLAEGSKATVSNSDIDAAKTVIEKRLDGMGLYDRSINLDYSNKRIVVEIPWTSTETSFDPKSITDEIGNTAVLTFAAIKQKDPNDAKAGYIQDGPVLVEGKDVTNAVAATDTKSPGYYAVSLQFNAAGTKAFADATTALNGKQLGIFLDGNLISYPKVNEPITSGMASITGNFTIEAAKSMANQIKSGSLPFKLVVDQGELRTITPVLGENALGVAMNAGAVALIAILLFMILYYRLPGVVAAIALIAHVALHVLFISWLQVSLTLPGIAGIIISIGMSVDANVIVFERMKEEITKGKNVTSTIRDGFKNALSAIVDGNIASILTALVLYYFGSGTIKGFAYTFIIGLLLNFVTAIWMTKSMLLSIDKLNIFKNMWWFGARKNKREEETA